MFCHDNTGTSPVSVDHCVYLHKAAIIYYIFMWIFILYNCNLEVLTGSFFPPCFKHSTPVGLKVVQWACSVQSSFTAVTSVILLSLKRSVLHAFKTSLSHFGNFLLISGLSLKRYQLLKAAFCVSFFILWWYILYLTDTNVLWI